MRGMELYQRAVAKDERELTRRGIPLTGRRGRLNPQAVGWSRYPHLHARMNGWGRRKRFDYWAISTPEIVFAFSVSHADYRAGLAIYFLDLKTLSEVTDGEYRWLPGRSDLPETSGDMPFGRVGRRSGVSITPNDDGTLLAVRSPRISAVIQVLEPPGHQSMGVVVPWTSKRFQYTRKDNCLRAEGWVEADGSRHEVSALTSWAALDHGRGKWPRHVLWNWGSGAGISDGHEIGLQFGAKWTDGTPSTENALRVDGVVHKLSHDVTWSYNPSDFTEPWTLEGPQVHLTFTPVHNRHSKSGGSLFFSREDQAFGHWNGTIDVASGRSHAVREVFGWAEEVHRIW